MSQHQRFNRLLMALLCALMLSTVAVSQAQPSDITQVVSTSDGQTSSIRIPAEQGVLTQSSHTALAQAEGEVVASDTGVFSIRLPQGWTFEPTSIINFADTLVFGDSGQSQQAIVDLINGEDTQSNVTGIGGFVGALELGGEAPDLYLSPLMDEILGSLTADVIVVEPPQDYSFAGQYPGELTLLDRGVIAVMHSQDQLLLSILISDDMDTNEAAMLDLLESIRMPAEEANPAAPTAQPTEPGASPTQASPAEAQTIRSSDERLSMQLPATWVALDHIADADTLAYGDSDAAAQSRLHSAQPDLAPQTAITGNGGLVIIYPMERFGIDPQNPDLAPLMERALGGLQGYAVEQEAQPLEGGALYAVISGAEHGYLALIPFDDQIAYVTATSAPGEFEANADLLLRVIQTVSVPAEVEQGGLGLGGLDTLDEEVEEEATPEPSGLGGL